MFYNQSTERGGVTVERRRSCCFTGHRPGKLPWGSNEEDPRCVALKAAIRDAVTAAYDEGYRHFICGMARGCDLYFAEAVVALRRERPGVTLEAAVPCPTQSRAWPAAERKRWQTLVDASDYETMVQEHYTPDCMLRRNRYMVDHSSLVIAVYDGADGGTRRTLEYAIAKKVPFVDIHPDGGIRKFCHADTEEEV